MKKIILLLAVVGMFSLQGCTGPEGPPGQDGFDGVKGEPGFVSEVFDVSNVIFNGKNGYSIFVNLDPKIYSGDVILVYRLSNIVNGKKVWNPIPESYYYDDGTLFFSYRFNFTQNDIEIYLDGFELNTIPNNLSVNQTFRIVIVPGNDGINSKKVLSRVDFSDYNAVVKKYNIDDSNIKVLN
jgi:hypothetical protein